MESKNIAASLERYRERQKLGLVATAAQPDEADTTATKRVFCQTEGCTSPIWHCGWCFKHYPTLLDLRKAVFP